MQENLGSYMTSRLTRVSFDCQGHVDHLGWSGGTPYLYFYERDQDRIPLSLLVGYEIRLEVEGTRICTECGSPTNETPPCSNCSNGPPFTPCVWNPGSRCTFQDCPYPDYKAKNCDQEFIVYLVAKDEIKVGITRSARSENRWCEQGADHAIAIAVAPNRKIAGIIEDLVGERLTTSIGSNWYEPLDNPVQSLAQAAHDAEDLFADSLHHHYRFSGQSPAEIERFVVDVPCLLEQGRQAIGSKVATISTGETREGKVIGVRGSNIATDRFVFNSKSHRGRRIRLETDAAFMGASK